MLANNMLCLYVAIAWPGLYITNGSENILTFQSPLKTGNITKL